LQAHPLLLIQWHTHLTTGRLCAIRPAGFKQFTHQLFTISALKYDIILNWRRQEKVFLCHCNECNLL
jgi:hypothetical protein